MLNCWSLWSSKHPGSTKVDMIFQPQDPAIFLFIQHHPRPGRTAATNLRTSQPDFESDGFRSPTVLFCYSELTYYRCIYTLSLSLCPKNPYFGRRLLSLLTFCPFFPLALFIFPFFLPSFLGDIQSDTIYSPTPGTSWSLPVRPSFRGVCLPYPIKCFSSQLLVTQLISKPRDLARYSSSPHPPWVDVRRRT